MPNNNVTTRKGSLGARMWQHRYVYLMLLPVMLYYLIFHYLPMVGVLIAFKDYSMKYSFWENIVNTPWVGFKHFLSFFRS